MHTILSHDIENGRSSAGDNIIMRKSTLRGSALPNSAQNTVLGCLLTLRIEW